MPALQQRWAEAAVDPGIVFLPPFWTAIDGLEGKVILVYAVIAGVLAGQIRSSVGGRTLDLPQLQLPWLVIFGSIPQLLVFYVLPANGVDDWWAAAALVTSQGILLLFVWANRRHPTFWLMGVGLMMNLAVILLNGGMMPISPETLHRLVPNRPPDSWQIGQRLGTTKDVVVSIAETRLWWLSDRFSAPSWFPYRFAFSLGDLWIALGAFWFLWESGGPSRMVRRS